MYMCEEEKGQIGLAIWGEEGSQDARRLVPGQRRRPLRLVGEEQKGTGPTFLLHLELRVCILCPWKKNASSSFNHQNPQMIQAPPPPTGCAGIFKATIVVIQQEGILCPWMMEELGIFSNSPGACSFTFSGRRVSPPISTLSRLPIKLVLTNRICHTHSDSKAST